MTALLEMRGISKVFPGVRALDNVSLTVEAGEIHAICGENGAGKSTLMKVLSGVYPHGSYEGDILYDGAPLACRNIRDSEDRGIIIIHQELALVPLLSIAENLFLGNEVAKRGVINWAEAFQRTEALLKKVGLNESPATKVEKLGVGKQQLIEIAKALAKDVRLLILDEPTAALQENDSQKLLDLMLELKAQGVSQIIISHKLNEVAEIAETGKLPVPMFCAGGIATPADASLVMQLGAESVFVGSGIFKSSDPEARAKAIEILASMIAQTLATSTQPQNEVADE